MCKRVRVEVFGYVIVSVWVEEKEGGERKRGDEEGE